MNDDNTVFGLVFLSILFFVVLWAVLSEPSPGSYDAIKRNIEAYEQ